jgi:hypothetical protein
MKNIKVRNGAVLKAAAMVVLARDADNSSFKRQLKDVVMNLWKSFKDTGLQVECKLPSLVVMERVGASVRL